VRWTTCGRSLPDWGAIADQIRVLPPRSGATRFVAIDGHGGAGKSTAAARLATALDGVPIVHTDDFASWENPVDWWPSLISEVLEPLAKGERATFVPTSWDGVARSLIEVSPAETVIVEGVTASREAFREYMAFSIWIDAPRGVCLRRGLDRDGEAARAQWESWLAAEDEYVAREQPTRYADLVVSGVDT
jgi:uridine kinase